MNKRIGLTVWLLMAISMAFSQEGIKGKIIDAATNQSLQGATIKDLQNQTNIISDQNGNFLLPGKTDSIEISSIGYHSRKLAVTNREMVIFLTPSFSNLNEIIVSGSREVQIRTEV